MTQQDPYDSLRLLQELHHDLLQLLDPRIVLGHQQEIRRETGHNLQSDLKRHHEKPVVARHENRILMKTFWTDAG